jgi:hypothetical protein
MNLAAINLNETSLELDSSCRDTIAASSFL